MSYHIIKQIVVDVFEKAKKGSVSHAPLALSKYIELETDNSIKYRTANRAYRKYIGNNEKIGTPIAETVNNFCKFLGYENYKDYIEKNTKEEEGIKSPVIEKGTLIESDVPKIEAPNPEPEPEKGKKNKKWILTIKITVAFALTFMLYQYVNTLWKNGDKPQAECMTWAYDHYEKIDCNLQLHPKYGTKAEPFSSLKSTMKKIEVNASTNFFSEATGQPLVWYYKTKKGTIEYFTAPGLHPVNGETLKKITEGIIKKYVPIHKTQPDSFISTDTVYSAKVNNDVSKK